MELYNSITLIAFWKTIVFRNLDAAVGVVIWKVLMAFGLAGVGCPWLN